MITSVRNEADIIESFVRYTLKFADGIVINENSSKDNTLEILKKLKKEGLKIDLIIDNNIKFKEFEKKKELLTYVMKKYSPDWILSLDADEFVFNKKYENPRDSIFLLNSSKANYLKWRTFVLKDFTNKNLFVPQKIIHRRLLPEEYSKVIMSKELFKKGCLFSLGSHFLIGLDQEDQANHCVDLEIAHYPIRSTNQIQTKVISGSLNSLSQNSRESDRSFHLIKLLDDMIRKGSIDIKDLFEESLYYAVKDRSIKINIKKEPLRFWFKENIKIKYPQKSLDLPFVTAISVASFLVEELREKNDILKEENLILKNNLLRKEEDYSKLNELYTKIIASKSWKIFEKISNIRKYVFRR